MNKSSLRLIVVANRVSAEPASDESPSALTGPHRLEYMADLMLQLKGMAEEHGWTTLSGILEVAYQEARSQARKC